MLSLRAHTEQIMSHPYALLDNLLVRGCLDLPIRKCHNRIQNIHRQLQVFAAVISQVKLLSQSLDVQILKACFEQPILQHEVSDQSNRILMPRVLDPKLVNRQFVEQLAELSNTVWNNRDFLEHLSRDRIDNVQQLREHLHVELVLPLLFTFAGLTLIVQTGI